MTERRALQICPNDHPPFQALCRVHARALGDCGLQVDTVYLGAPQTAPDRQARYLATAGSVGAMRRALVRAMGSRDYTLTVAHRYRAARVAVAARRSMKLGQVVAIAHEFGMLQRRRRRLWRQWLANDVRFAGVSRPVADELSAARDRRPDAAIMVIPNALDIEAFDGALAPRGAARRELKLTDDAFVIAVVGRLHPKKRPELALQGFRDALPRLPARARLVFVGEGELREALMQQIARAGLDDRVILLGNVANASRYFAAFDLLLATPSEDEAFGMVLLEAMAARIPILCADTPGPRYVLGSGGYYFRTAADLGMRLVDAVQHPPPHLRHRLEAEFSVAALVRVYQSLGITPALPPAIDVRQTGVAE